MTDLPNDPAERARLIARNLIEMLPHATALGLHLDAVDEGAAAISMPWRQDLVGDPVTGVIHGGAVSALMDTCCGAAVLSHPDVAGPVATIDLRIDYMRAATSGQRIRARAELYHLTRSVAFVRAHAYDDDDSRPVASATGTFTTGGA